jgi:hypothetical protein
LALAVTLAASALGLALAPADVTEAEGTWDCKGEMANLHGDFAMGDPGGGGETQDEAVRLFALDLLESGILSPTGELLSRDDFMAAIDSKAGDDRYDQETGIVYVDGVVVADFGSPSKLPNGNWGVEDATFCAITWEMLTQQQEEDPPTPQSSPSHQSSGA